MEEIGAVSKIESPTDWCAGMVVVPKANGEIRICVDMTKLNEALCSERHILPAVTGSVVWLTSLHKAGCPQRFLADTAVIRE